MDLKWTGPCSWIQSYLELPLMKAPQASELMSLGHLQDMEYGSYQNFIQKKLSQYITLLVDVDYSVIKGTVWHFGKSSCFPVFARVVGWYKI